MKQTINISIFVDEFQSIRPGNFSYDGLNVLFDYLEEYEDAAGQEMELDIIALCCEFSEYEDLEDFKSNYGDDFQTIEDIHSYTTVIEISGTDRFIIQDF